MSETDKQVDQKKGDDVLKRMLKTKPKPEVKNLETKSGTKNKPSDSPAKKSRSEKS